MTSTDFHSNNWVGKNNKKLVQSIQDVEGNLSIRKCKYTSIYSTIASDLKTYIENQRRQSDKYVSRILTNVRQTL